MKARQAEVYNENGDLEKIEITLESGDHLFDAVWNPEDEQNDKNRIDFRQWVRRMVDQHGHELT